MRGEWIEILPFSSSCVGIYGLSPCGESGLKFFPHAVISVVLDRSLPMRGEWIEISCGPRGSRLPPGLSPCGESGLKLTVEQLPAYLSGLSPCGESGLKCQRSTSGRRVCPSLPMRGEWIEIFTGSLLAPRFPSLPMRGEWIEIFSAASFWARRRSLPMRGEWIEMAGVTAASAVTGVSPHAGRVD